MGRIASALGWSGVDVMLSMFTLWDWTKPLPPVSSTAPALDVSFDPPPKRVGTWFLEDALGFLPRQAVFEYDFVFTKLPRDLEGALRGCFRAAHDAGAHAAWFGFEGSFHFEHLLADPTQIYAVSDSFGAVVASDDMLDSGAWKERLAMSANAVRTRTR